MPTLHPNTTFDPIARATALVRELEAEALDEDQVGAALSMMGQVLRTRQVESQQRTSEQFDMRLADSRRGLIAAKVKGVKPGLEGPARVLAPGEQPQLPASLIRR